MNDTFTRRSVCAAVVERYPQVRPAQAVAFAMEGLVRVNGCPARHPDQQVHPTDQVTVDGLPARVRPRLVVAT